MRFPQLVLFEPEPRLLGLLRSHAQERQWTIRQPRTIKSCLKQIRSVDSSVVVMRPGKEIEREMELLVAIRDQSPVTPVVVVLDMDNPPWLCLAWDLGADFVLSPPQAVGQLHEIITGLMERAMKPMGNGSATITQTFENPSEPTSPSEP